MENGEFLSKKSERFGLEKEKVFHVKNVVYEE
jgi:hypothetical protein